MKKRISSLLLVLGLVLCQVPYGAVTAEEVAEEEAVVVFEESQAEEPVYEEVPAEVLPEPETGYDTEAETPSESVQPVNPQVESQQAVQPAETPAESIGEVKPKDVYIDNTVDNSVSYVTGAIHLTGSGGTQAGYGDGKVIYEEKASVIYSNPKTAQVQGLINDAYTKVYQTANDIKKRGKQGEFHMSTSETAGKVWDNRKYETVEDDDALVIGDVDYLDGAYGETEEYSQTHIASGDYGKETFYRVEANGWVKGYSITVSKKGYGEAKADLAESLSEETVTLTAEPETGYVFRRWEAVSGEVTFADAESATTTFVMPAADVEIQAVFDDNTVVGAFGASEGGSYTLVAGENPHDAMEGGDGNIGSMNATLQRGESATVTATPADGYTFKGWYGGVMGASHFLEGDDGSLISTDASYTFTAEEGISLYAVFEKIEHKHTLVKTDEVPATCEKEGTKAYWSCTECGKLFSDENGKNSIEAPQKIKALGHDWGDWVVTVEPTETTDGEETRTCKNDPSHTETRTIPALTIEYRNTSGDGSSYTKGSKEALSFTFKRSFDDEVTFDHFTGVQVDGEELDSSSCTAEAGSVVITLLPAYLETLAAGDYTLTAMFDDGNDVTVSFTVKEKKEQKSDDSGNKEKKETKPTNAPAKTRTPATGDDSPTGLYMALLAVSLLAILTTLTYRRKTR